MKKFLIILAAVLAVGSISQTYARIPITIGELTIKITGEGGVVVNSGGNVSICPIPNRNVVCAVLTIRTPSHYVPFDDGFGLIDFSQDFRGIVDVTPIFLDSDRGLLINNVTGELIDVEVLDIQVFDSVPLQMERIELPSLMNSSRIERGSVLLIAE